MTHPITRLRADRSRADRPWADRSWALAGALLLAACGGDAASGGPRAAGGAAAPAPAAQTPFTGLRIVPVANAKLATVRNAPVWKNAPVLNVVVLPQQITTPRLVRATVTALEVQAIHDDAVVAFRLRWRDSTKDELYEQDLFPDACAVQLPLDESAAFTMGHAGARVQILHWKALWQRDVERGFQDVQDLHPNFWIDHYWFATGGWPHPVPAAFEDPRSHAWFPALQAGNPMSVWNRKEPAQELIAEGFGSATAHPASVTRARGEHADGQWTVVFLRPLRTEDEADHVFGSSPAQVNFAIWDGSGDNVGARKHYSMWYEYRVETP